MNTHHFLEYVIRPTLERLDHGRRDEAVENLLLGTAIVESQGLGFLKQISGPALGVYQIEPETHQDVWDNYLAFRADLASKVRSFASQTFQGEAELVPNLAYSTAIARVIYLRVKAPIPNDLEGQAAYWKNHYNTRHGKGTTQHYLALYHKYHDSTIP